MFNTSQPSSDSKIINQTKTKVPTIQWKFPYPPRWQLGPDRWCRHVSDLPPAPPPGTSSGSAFRLCSCSGPVSERGLWSIQQSPSETGTRAVLSVPAPTVEGGWIGQASEKASRGKKGTLCSSPTWQKIQSACTAHPPTLSQPLGWEEVSRHNYPLQISPLAPGREGPRLRGRAVIELEVILIITHLRHVQPFGARVKSISWARHIFETRGAVIQGASLLHIHTTFNRR